jgi:hypothetical protein
MDSQEKKKVWIGLTIGLGLFLGGWAVLFTKVRGPWAMSHMNAPLAIALVMLVVSVPFYLSGCAALARAKGYSSAILLTCVLGWLFPVVVLLALPDKKKRRRW